jgi:Lysyl oxidase
VKNIFYGSKNLPNYGLGNFNGCDANIQGISVGGYDTYGMFFEGQYLTLPKGTKNGTYILEIEVDPNKKYMEKDKTNMIFSMEIELKKQQK